MTTTSRAPVREILLATDFSAASEPAVDVARAWARHFGARVHLVHVASPDDVGLTGLLAGLAASFTPSPTVVRVLPGGAPATAIVRYARAANVDLIVMGTHGRTGVSRVLLGSVAERVARTAPCPVVTVPALPPPPIAEAIEAPGIRHCLVCARDSEDLICEPCRAKIRGELLDRKQREERAGRV